MARAYLGLGSNLGDRARRLQDAIDHLAASAEVTVVGVSPVYETAPVGGPEQPDYLNAVVGIETEAAPRRLLELAHELEDAAGRTRGEHWGPRTLDVDVLLVGDARVDDEDLVVPHPRLWERAFVMVPLADLDPSYESRVPDRAGVRRTEIELASPEAQ